MCVCPCFDSSIRLYESANVLLRLRTSSIIQRQHRALHSAAVIQNPARQKRRSYSKSSNTEEKELFKIQQERESDDLLKIQQEREGDDLLKIQQEREGDGGERDGGEEEGGDDDDDDDDGGDGSCV